jgi:putative transposase
MGWKQLLAYITGSVDQELLRYNEYLAAENRILRRQLRGRVRLTNGDRKTLAEIGKRLGKQALAQVATIVQPDTPFWPGTAGWWRRSSVVPGSGRCWVGRRSTRSWRPW